MEIICIGDSLTYGYGVRRTQRWTELATERSGWKLINHGVCGDTTGGMLVRMREILRDLHSGKDERCFLLMGGYNDLVPQIFVGDKFTKEDLIRLGDGGLCQMCKACHFPNCTFGSY